MSSPGTVEKARVIQAQSGPSCRVQTHNWSGLALNAVPMTHAAEGDEVLVAFTADTQPEATVIANLTRSQSKTISVTDSSGALWLEIDPENKRLEVHSPDGELVIHAATHVTLRAEDARVEARGSLVQRAREIDSVATGEHRIDGALVKIACETVS